MIAIRHLDHFTKRHLEAMAPYARKELDTLSHYAWYMLQMSFKWELVEDEKILGVFGIFQSSAFSAPTFWFLLAKDFNARRHVRACRYFVDMMKAGREHVTTAVETDYKVGHKFARLCGFAPTGVELSFEGKNYHQYKAA